VKNDLGTLTPVFIKRRVFFVFGEYVPIFVELHSINNNPTGGIMLTRKKLKTIMLVSLVLFLWVGLSTAFAGTIAGTVTNASSETDTRVYLKVMSDQGWDTIFGTSITTPGAYTIRHDLPDGNYQAIAVLDTVGEGVAVSSMPMGSSEIFAVTGGIATDVNIQLNDPTGSDLVPAAPQMVVTVPGDSGIFLFWEGSRNMNDFAQAESYNVYIKQNSAPEVGVDTPVLSNLSENDMDFAFLSGLINGGNYYVGVTGVIGASESAITLALDGAAPTVPAAPTGASNIVSGTINITGPALTGPLYVLLMDDSNEKAAWVKLDSPTAATVYSVSDLADGNYFVMPFVDQDNNGYLSSGDLANMDYGPRVMVSGGDVTGMDVSVTNSGAYANVGTGHQIYDNGSPDTYSLLFTIDRNFKLPVGVAVTAGLSETIDLGIDSWGGFDAWRQNGTSRPGVPELYDFLVTYSDGSSETIQVGTTAVLDSPAMPLGPIGQVAGATTPTFRWVGPQVDEVTQPFSYELYMYDGQGFNWDSDDIPSDQFSYTYDGQPLVTDTQYFWQVSIFDKNDNNVSYNVDFTPVAASPVTISGGANDSVGMLAGVNVTEVGNPGNSAVTDAGGLFSLQIAQGSVFALEFSKTGYPTMQTKFMTAGSSFNAGTWYMFTNEDFASMGTSVGTGIIRSKVKDANTGSPLVGATVTALSSLSPGTSYTVQYFDSTAENWSGVATDDSGKFRVKDVIDGDTVILTGNLGGYDFAEFYMQVYADQMALGSVRGTPLLIIDSDGDGLLDVDELALGTNPNNPDTDGDSFTDGDDSHPLTINANINYFALLHSTQGDGSQVGEILFAVNGISSDLGGLSAVVTGPNGFSHTVQDDDISAGGDFYLSPPTLGEGIYTLTVIDSVGGSVTRTDTYTGLQATPLVDLTAVKYALQPDGNYIFHWPHVDAQYSYFYRLRIVHVPTGEIVLLSPRSHSNRVWVNSSYLPDASTNAYKLRVEANDRDHISLLFNRSRGSYMSFTANQGNVNGLLNGPLIYNRVESGGNHYVVPTVGLPEDPSLVTSATVTNSQGYTYSFDLETDYEPFDNTLMHKFPVTDPLRPTQTGTYHFEIVSSGTTYEADSTLTSAVAYPAPDSTSYQVENLDEVENPDNDRYRFSWADVNHNGLLYYRVMFLNAAGDYYVTSRQNRNNVVVNMKSVTDRIGTGPLRWRAEVHDSSSWSTLRNRRNGPLVDLTLPAYAPYTPYLYGRFNNRNFANGDQLLRSYAQVEDFSRVLALEVTGPDLYELDLKLDGDLYMGLGYGGYLFNETRPVQTGLYIYHLTDADGSATYYDTLTAAAPLPVVNYHSVHIDQLASGNLLLSWAPVFHSSPLWYNLVIKSLADHNQDGFPDEVLALWNQNKPYAEIPANTLPAEPLVITIQARDASSGSVENNRSVSVNIGYEGPGFDYGSLLDEDNDGWANNVDADDTDPSVYPFSEPVEPTPLEVVFPNGGETLEAGHSVNLTWQAQTGADHYTVRLSINGGASFWNLATGITETSLAYTVDNLNTSNAIIRVVAYDSGNGWLASDNSDTSFSIVKYGTVLTPNGGETLAGGTQTFIDWADHPDATRYKVRISTNSGGKFWTLQDNITQSQTTLTLPNLNSDQVLIKVVGYNASNQWLVGDNSDATLRITKGGTVLTPNGGEMYQPGETLNVTWAAHGQADHYVVRFSVDGGASFWTLPNAGNVTTTSYNWTLPNWLNSDQCMVLIQTYNASGTWIAADRADTVFSAMMP
jgi:hypothetical protein